MLDHLYARWNTNHHISWNISLISCECLLSFLAIGPFVLAHILVASHDSLSLLMLTDCAWWWSGCYSDGKRSIRSHDRISSESCNPQFWLICDDGNHSRTDVLLHHSSWLFLKSATISASSPLSCIQMENCDQMMRNVDVRGLVSSHQFF